eukprot:1317046-Amorphochlora_amoeboformis.AAC.1
MVTSLEIVMGSSEDERKSGQTGAKNPALPASRQCHHDANSPREGRVYPSAVTKGDSVPWCATNDVQSCPKGSESLGDLWASGRPSIEYVSFPPVIRCCAPPHGIRLFSILLRSRSTPGNVVKALKTRDVPRAAIRFTTIYRQNHQDDFREVINKNL